MDRNPLGLVLGAHCVGPTARAAPPWLAWLPTTVRLPTAPPPCPQTPTDDTALTRRTVPDLKGR
jgi:hypothetical protein